MEFIRPDLPSKCTWHRNADPATSPHSKAPYGPKQKILPNILEAIGNTPMIKLNQIPKTAGIKCEMLAKCEFFNPGGSVKDRIGHRMIEDAEKKGLLKPGYTIIEPTSGNTGIGLAMASAVKGYRCIIVMPLKMSNEKVDILRALGAEIVRTPTEAAFDSPEGLIAVSQKIQRETPNSIILDQYRNAGNPLAHYDLTATEIYDQCGGKIDMVVIGAGTGGTISGIGRKLKELCPNCTVVGVDPEGSILAEPANLNKSDVTFYEVEGVGYDFIPTVLDRSVVDVWVKVKDIEALPMAKRLIKEEGLLCGGSSGAAVASAIKVAAALNENQRCVVLLPDGVRNYMTKFLSDQWMEARALKPCINAHEHWWWDIEVNALNLDAPMTMPDEVTCSTALAIMKQKGYDQLPVVNYDQSLVGMITISNIMNLVLNNKIKVTDQISKALTKQFRTVQLNSKLGLVSRILEKESFVLVVDEQQANTICSTGILKPKNIVGVITNIDVLQFISHNNQDADIASHATNGIIGINNQKGYMNSSNGAVLS